MAPETREPKKKLIRQCVLCQFKLKAVEQCSGQSYKEYKTTRNKKNSNSSNTSAKNFSATHGAARISELKIFKTHIPENANLIFLLLYNIFCCFLRKEGTTFA